MRNREFTAFLFKAFLLGAVAGTQVAGLLYFLNPHLAFEARPVSIAVGFYSIQLGVFSLAISIPFYLRFRRVRQHWFPIGLTLVLATAGLGAWVHAFYFPFYLPPGINRRLLKAAIWLSLSALLCFYTTLLHRMRHRPYGRKSQALFLLMAAASAYVVLERREAFRPTIKPTPRETTFQSSQRPRLFVVGIESATLDAVLPLAEQEKLPFFARIIQEGSYSRLSTLRPVRRYSLWTTLATGKYPYRHGVVGEQTFESPILSEGDQLRILPLGLGFRHWGVWSPPARAKPNNRKNLATWEILTRMGIPSAVVGWPLTSSDESLYSLSDRFFDGDPEAGPAQTELMERARLFRTEVEDLDPTRTSQFGLEPEPFILEALVSDLWRIDLSLFLIDQDPQIGALFLTLPGLSEVSERFFGGYSAVQFEGLQDPSLETAADIVSAYYMHLDQALASFWERLDESDMLIVVSVNGAEGSAGWHEARRLLLRRPELRGSIDNPSDGVICFLGGGFQVGALLRPADLVDLVPTLLYGLGFPIARDLDGAVLTHAFDTSFLARHPLTFLPSYESLSVRRYETAIR